MTEEPYYMSGAVEAKKLESESLQNTTPKLSCKLG